MVKTKYLQYGIIAAGEGSRLANEGIETPKPLVEILDEKLIDRLIRIFCDNGATTIHVICNALSNEVRQHLKYLKNNGYAGYHPDIVVTVKTTPSSMHSLYELSKSFDKDVPFVVTTVDTIFKEQRFAEYIEVLKEVMLSEDEDGLMGVTSFIDDEKPLYVDIDSKKQIKGFYDKTHTEFVSAGIYGLASKSLLILSDCIQNGESRMRNFQRALINAGLKLSAFDMGKVIDIDHAEDIRKAEELIK